MAQAVTGIDDGKLMEYKEEFSSLGLVPSFLISAIGLFAAAKIWRGPAVREALS